MATTKALSLPTLSAISMPNPPPPGKVKIKKWGKVNRRALTNLIEEGEVDITNLTAAYIDTVRSDFFSHRDKSNFRRNFRDFAAAWDLEAEYSGARRQESAGKSRVCPIFYSLFIYSTLV